MRAAATIRAATPRDLDQLTAALAKSFRDDPVFTWLLPDAHARESRARGVFATMLRTGALRLGGVELAELDGAIVGGAIWYPPDRWQPGFLDQLRAVPGYVRAFRRRIGPASELLQALARAHPHAPHWYLYVVGVDPSHQGRGVAGTLLRSRLDRCDVAGDPAYLEATSVATVPLYAHLGFEATGTPALPSGAPVVTAMWRAPAGRAAR